MSLLLTKIEGTGNGIKTVIPNMSDVARALSQLPMYPTKFFACEVGAQTSFDEKNDGYIVNGAHDVTKLRELLDGFIDKFVLCKSCKTPQTDLIITKNDEIIHDCKACGECTGVDIRYKPTTFILKNPPKASSKKSKGMKQASGDGSPSLSANSDGHKNGDAADEADVAPLVRTQDVLLEGIIQIAYAAREIFRYVAIRSSDVRVLTALKHLIQSISFPGHTPF
ncbi:hypothetical protein SCP_0201760 [Sparassis crispa]|uniref:Translation initiation factor IF2/IF5 domain-containing protein n=1 Tax=Sparassis crispa TaxID=139825 RepID=A0A401GA07_9APHY|nr:hypothetical protein SCP_0201760 [Sparassis crispa]GBE78979.1 hypothetical protein SCP_0201760 [Sparassis crispa]